MRFNPNQGAKKAEGGGSEKRAHKSDHNHKSSKNSDSLPSVSLSSLVMPINNCNSHTIGSPADTIITNTTPSSPQFQEVDK